LSTPKKKLRLVDNNGKTVYMTKYNVGTRPTYGSVCITLMCPTRASICKSTLNIAACLYKRSVCSCEIDKI